MGYLWSRMPILPANENFQIDVEFAVRVIRPRPPASPTHQHYRLLTGVEARGGQVDGKTSSHNLFGDGFAMWLTTDRAKPGPVFGSVGASPFPSSVAAY